MRLNKQKSKVQKPSRLAVEAVRYFSLIISKIFWRIKFTGTANIPEQLDEGLIIVPNHQTYFDPFWVCNPIKRDMRFLAWDEAFRWFFIGRLMRKVGAFPVSLKKGGTISALKKSLEFLNDGKTLLVFPEGEREFSDGKLLNFKIGAVKLALKTDVPILPVTVKGGNHIWSRDHRLPRPGKVEIIYHPIIKFEKTPEKASINEKTQQLKAIIESKL